MLDNSIRRLAKAAKMRLNRASKETIVEPKHKGDNIVTIKSNFQTYKNLYNGVYEVVKLKDNDDELYNKVCALLDENYDSSQILGDLIDTKLFKKLSESEKDRYIVNLADKYLELKQRYIKNHEVQFSIWALTIWFI